MNKLLITFLIFSSLEMKGFCQEYKDCKGSEKIFVQAEVEPQFDGLLQDYFEKQFSGKFNGYNGSISVIILIDSNGNVCCSKIEFNRSDISSDVIKRAVNGMSAWKPAIQNKCKVAFYIELQFIFNGTKFLVMEAGKDFISKPLLKQ
jgi:hypothetical protein